LISLHNILVLVKSLIVLPNSLGWLDGGFCYYSYMMKKTKDTDMKITPAEARRIATFKSKTNSPLLRFLHGMDDASIIRLSAILEEAAASSKKKV